jgi:hypothetical protein
MRAATGRPVKVEAVDPRPRAEPAAHQRTTAKGAPPILAEVAARQAKVVAPAEAKVVVVWRVEQEAP